MRGTVKKTHEDPKKNAALLKESQERDALVLAYAQKGDATDLKKRDERTAINHLQIKNARGETIADSIEQTAATLAKSQKEAAALLEAAQLKAAEVLKVAQDKAAIALQETHAKAIETHEEKDQVISWLSGDYSVKKG